MSSEPEIHSASAEDVAAVAPLFEAYRVWYGESPDPDGSYNFIAQRLRNNESTIFFATIDGEPVGFTQLYPLFSSVSVAPIWLLNDLFVSEKARGKGVSVLLLEAAAEFGRQTGAIRLELETEITNTKAQAIYEKHGWVRNESHYFYSLQLD